MQRLEKNIKSLAVPELWKLSAKIALCESEEHAERGGGSFGITPHKQEFWSILHALINEEIIKRNENDNATKKEH